MSNQNSGYPQYLTQNPIAALPQPKHALQDVSGGKPVQVGDSDLWGMEIDVAAAAEEIRNIGKADKGKGVDDFLSGVGLGAFAEQLKDLRLGKQQCTPLGLQNCTSLVRRHDWL